jgi:Mycolic acid cyclopropane synthetase
VRAHSITLSRAQHDFAQQRIADADLQALVTVELRDYRDLQGEAVYDKVASVGMFEHVGLANMPTYLAADDLRLRWFPEAHLPRQLPGARLAVNGRPRTPVDRISRILSAA